MTLIEDRNPLAGLPGSVADGLLDKGVLDKGVPDNGAALASSFAGESFVDDDVLGARAGAGAGVAPLVRVENLRVGFDVTDSRTGVAARREVITGISFSIAPGETVGIVGESGSGKSVTVRTLLGLNAANQTTQADRLEVFGRDGLALSEGQWAGVRGEKIGFVLQDALSSLDPLKTIGLEIAEALQPRRRPRLRKFADAIYRLLEDVGIPDPELRARQYSHELSGGLRQRALIASAIAQNPDLIIADEPTTALDVTVQAQILELLRRKAAEGHAIIMVSHDLAVIGSVCDRIIVMKDGQIVEEGPSREILTNPREAYTKLLLAAVPSARSRGYRLSSVERVALPAKPASAEGGTNDAPVLVASGITKEFVGRHGSRIAAVDDAHIELHPGRTLGVVGESGSGKSTLARIIAALLEPDGGEVRLDGETWSPLPEKARRGRRHEIQVVAQNPLASFDPRYTVTQLIAEPLRELTSLNKAEIAARVEEVLDLVQLPKHLANSSPRRLSGGQRQRVAIARAIATNPRILIADEAVSALDVSIQAQILDLLADIQAQTNVAILFISHDLGVIHHISDSIVVMRHGQIVEQGLPEDVLVNPAHPYTQRLIASLPQLPESAAAAQLPVTER
ncbi:MAG: ABC transporter ATP-binding protein [Ancrocorticia sp.]